MTKLVDIEGIGDKYAAALTEADVGSVEHLLELGSTPKGRKDLAERSGLSGKLILRWINMADLFRIKGVGEEYADLLEASGVDTVPELAQRNPSNLHKKMVEVNEAKNLVRQAPAESNVIKWVAQAKELPRAIHY